MRATPGHCALRPAAAGRTAFPGVRGSGMLRAGSGGTADRDMKTPRVARRCPFSG